jgi:hypothetical protein
VSANERAVDERADGPATSESPPERAPTAERARPSAATAAAHQVALIVSAAERAAEQLRLDTEERVRSRIAEGERAAQYRVKAADEEAIEIIQSANDEATRARQAARDAAEQAKTAATSEAVAIVAQARQRAEEAIAQAMAEAAKDRSEAEEQSRALLRTAEEHLREAHTAAADVRTEGIALVGHLHQMGDSLRANAELLLRDVKNIHAQMVAQLDRAQEGMSRTHTPRGRERDGPSRSPERDLAPVSSDGEVLDVPEFIPPG